MLCYLEETRRYKKCGPHDGQLCDIATVRELCSVHDPK